MGRRKTYIHYGSNQYIRERFITIRNQPCFNKPIGGLWASPLHSKNGWKQWATREQYTGFKGDSFFTFQLRRGAKVLKIETKSDLNGIPRVESPIESLILLDFERIKQDYDAIEVVMSEEMYMTMYGWDCDSLLVLNPEVIEVKGTNLYKRFKRL